LYEFIISFVNCSGVPMLIKFCKIRYVGYFQMLLLNPVRVYIIASSFLHASLIIALATAACSTHPAISGTNPFYYMSNMLIPSFSCASCNACVILPNMTL
jgi:hypothetical protein